MLLDLIRRCNDLERTGIVIDSWRMNKVESDPVERFDQCLKALGTVFQGAWCTLYAEQIRNAVQEQPDYEAILLPTPRHKTAVAATPPAYTIQHGQHAEIDMGVHPLLHVAMDRADLEVNCLHGSKGPLDLA